MKNAFLFFVLTMSMFACDNPPENTDFKYSDQYPADLQKVLEAHGGLSAWQEMNALQFEKDGETHFVDLKSRRDRIKGSNYELGFDGDSIWVDADTSYKGKPAFYHNLYFYFYAMPFVLADDGIIYSKAEPITVDSVTYSGIHIGFKDGVGQVSLDEYILYYHPETYQMAWLGYTVTFFSKERSKKFKWINYNKWATFSDDIVLPTELTWYSSDEDGKITTLRKSVEFKNTIINKRPFDDETFQRTENAVTVE